MRKEQPSLTTKSCLQSLTTKSCLQSLTTKSCLQAKNVSALICELTNAQYLVSLMKMTSSDVDTSEQGQKDRLKHVEMTLEALYHVIHNNPGVEM